MTNFVTRFVSHWIFQLTSSRRGWLYLGKKEICLGIFQLTSSRRGWRKCRWGCYGLEYFNSHPHEEDDSNSRSWNSLYIISTHILTKRMTCSSLFVFFVPYISTHILTKRMTSSKLALSSLRIFQLTSSRRGWLQNWNMILVSFNFNSHPHEEDDEPLTTPPFELASFQLTSSRRGWQMLTLKQAEKMHFNSHPHEEDDVDGKTSVCWRGISTHILTKRMTFASPSPIFLLYISTHILTKRMTDSDRLTKFISFISTHILTKRMTNNS